MAPRVPRSRRDILKLAGGLVAGGVWSAPTSARPVPDGRRSVRLNVGYRDRSGRRHVEAVADRTVREFDLDAVTVEAHRRYVPRLRRAEPIEYVEPDQPVHTLATPLNYGVDRTDADVAHAKGATGGDIDIAVVDTGIDPNHPALVSNLGTGRNFAGTDGRYDRTEWRDVNGHGTHCSGLIGATGAELGVCPEVTLHSLRAIGPAGHGTLSDAVAAIRYAARKGWEVANLSFGTGYSRLLIDACRTAWSAGTTLVAAAGGAGRSYPSQDPSTLAVGAVDRRDDPAPFSPGTGVVDLVAPGAGLRSTVPKGYERRSGTSMACALVAGAVAQLLAEGYKGMAARHRLRRSAADLGLPVERQGDGLLDVAAALGYPSGDDLSGAEPS